LNDAIFLQAAIAWAKQAELVLKKNFFLTFLPDAAT